MNYGDTTQWFILYFNNKGEKNMRVNLIDRKTTVAGNVTRLDMLLLVDSEYQHHYISLPLSATGAEVRQWIKEYIDKNVRWRNYSDEQQLIEKRAFKGGRL